MGEYKKTLSALRDSNQGWRFKNALKENRIVWVEKTITTTKAIINYKP